MSNLLLTVSKKGFRPKNGVKINFRKYKFVFW